MEAKAKAQPAIRQAKVTPSAVDPYPGNWQHESMKVREAIKLIESDGWYLDRTRGSHRQYKHPQKRGLVTIPGKPTMTLRRALKTVSLSKQD